MLPFPNYYISTPIMSEKKSIVINHNNRRKMRWPPTLLTGGERHGGCKEEGRGEDDLAAVKAAAWAWYQRNEGKPMMMREFDLTTRTSRTPLPSRYKLEANRNMILSDSENRVNSKSHKDHLLLRDQEIKRSSLLDTYEIKSISKRINEGSTFRNDHDDHHYDHVILQKKVEYDSKKENGFVKKVSIRNLWKGIILMAPRTVCGRSDDVDHMAYRSGPRTLKVAPTLVNLRNNRQFKKQPSLTLIVSCYLELFKDMCLDI